MRTKSGRRHGLMVLGGALVLVAGAALALDARQFGLLERGMSEAEVVARVGEPDRETVVDNINVYRKIWYYMPDRPGARGWMTEIVFNDRGKVISLDRRRR